MPPIEILWHYFSSWLYKRWAGAGVQSTDLGGIICFWMWIRIENLSSSDRRSGAGVNAPGYPHRQQEYPDIHISYRVCLWTATMQSGKSGFWLLGDNSALYLSIHIFSHSLFVPINNDCQLEQVLVVHKLCSYCCHQKAAGEFPDSCNGQSDLTIAPGKRVTRHMNW